jgi:hypothetical protein
LPLSDETGDEAAAILKAGPTGHAGAVDAVSILSEHG